MKIKLLIERFSLYEGFRYERFPVFVTMVVNKVGCKAYNYSNLKVLLKNLKYFIGHFTPLNAPFAALWILLNINLFDNNFFGSL